MEIGIHYINFRPDAPERLGPDLAATARAAEDAGFGMFTLADHLFQMEMFGPATDPFLECYTALGYLAGVTNRITLAPLVVGVTYRHPGVLLKAASTLDALSQGRSVFSIGAAWYEREHLALGVPYPATKVRFEMLEEALQIAQQMWSADDGPYTGTHYQLAETICAPQPVTTPPILIGGGGEKKTLRLVAQYADIWNSTAGLDEAPHKLEVLRGHCADVGRDPASIRLTQALMVDPFADLDEFRRTVDRCAELGFDLINVGPPAGGSDPADWVKRFGDEVAPLLPA